MRVGWYQPGDEKAIIALMALSDFDPWNDQKPAYNMAQIIPEGWFLAVDAETKTAVGTACCLHHYSGKTPFTGDVGWVFCDSQHSGEKQ